MTYVLRKNKNKNKKTHTCRRGHLSQVVLDQRLLIFCHLIMGTLACYYLIIEAQQNSRRGQIKCQMNFIKHSMHIHPQYWILQQSRSTGSFFAQQTRSDNLIWKKKLRDIQHNTSHHIITHAAGHKLALSQLMDIWHNLKGLYECISKLYLVVVAAAVVATGKLFLDLLHHALLLMIMVLRCGCGGSGGGGSGEPCRLQMLVLLLPQS